MVATMRDAVDALVRDDYTVVIEGFTHLICFAAGHEIKVPMEWTVTLDVIPIMGDVKDKRIPAVAPPPLGPPAPTLVVRGSVVMGEVKITD